MNLMKNQVIQKKFSFEILKEGVARQKNYVQWVNKMFSFTWDFQRY
jgi:hypothetical protein